MVFVSSFEPVKPPECYQDSVAEFFWHQLHVFAENTLLVDYASKRQWTGQQMKQVACKVAYFLVNELELKPNDSCVFFFPNSDYIHMTALGVLFAGGSVCAGYRDDPPDEHLHMLRSMEPKVVFADTSLWQELDQVRRDGNVMNLTGDRRLDFHLCLLNDQEPINDDRVHSTRTVGFHQDLLSYSASPVPKLPVRVNPNEAAFVLMTSGSTGRPKPVARSHRNSLYVCHELDSTGGRLWQLDSSSVLANQLELDHGTGIFSLKMCVAKGVRLVVMDGYKMEQLLDAIDSYKISDCMLGSALLHNLISALMSSNGKLGHGYSLASLRNLIAIGSPISSPEACEQFMAEHPQLSIRQAFGMTETGILSIVPRELTHKSEGSVGQLVSNVEIKLVDPSTGQEIDQLDQEGELFVRGPTVSPGYLGRQHTELSRVAFQADGFYRSYDICKFSRAHTAPHSMLMFIRGRYQEVLCLNDGWKVLPAEIEHVLMQHPRVLEAAVIGIPHPHLPTCHAPRAFVVARPDGGQEDEQSLVQSILEFSAARLSGPKQLAVGGIKLMDSLPRISVGKVDKKLLRKLDGY